MSWIREVPVEEATGLLKEEYEVALERAGRVWHIVQVMSINPEALSDSLRLYVSIMKDDSPLTRVQREMLATVVSRELDCFY